MQVQSQGRTSRATNLAIATLTQQQDLASTLALVTKSDVAQVSRGSAVPGSHA